MYIHIHIIHTYTYISMHIFIKNELKKMITLKEKGMYY